MLITESGDEAGCSSRVLLLSVVVVVVLLSMRMREPYVVEVRETK